MESNRDLIAYLEKLSRLQLSESEREDADVELARILTYMEALQQMDTSELEMTSPLPSPANRLRVDRMMPSLEQECILAAAPEKHDGYFKVPNTVD